MENYEVVSSDRIIIIVIHYIIVVMIVPVHIQMSREAVIITVAGDEIGCWIAITAHLFIIVTTIMRRRPPWRSRARPRSCSSLPSPRAHHRRRVSLGAGPQGDVRLHVLTCPEQCRRRI